MLPATPTCRTSSSSASNRGFSQRVRPIAVMLTNVGVAVGRRGVDAEGELARARPRRRTWTPQDGWPYCCRFDMTSPWVRIGLSSLMGLGMALGSLTAHAAAGHELGRRRQPDDEHLPRWRHRDQRRARLSLRRRPRRSTTSRYRTARVIEVTAFNNSAVNKATLGNLVLKTPEQHRRRRDVAHHGARARLSSGRVRRRPRAQPLHGGRHAAVARCATRAVAARTSVAAARARRIASSYPGDGTDVPAQFPQEWEEDCSTKVAMARVICDVDQDPTQPGGSVPGYGITTERASSVTSCPTSRVSRIGTTFSIPSSALPVATRAVTRRLRRDELRAGDGGGRIVLFAGNAGKIGAVNINGRVTTDGRPRLLAR